MTTQGKTLLTSFSQMSKFITKTHIWKAYTEQSVTIQTIIHQAKVTYQIKFLINEKEDE